jgi:ABC-type branched-subunit amino acid transport system ATPase component
VARRLIVLAEGRLIADGVPEFVMQDRIVREVYLGAEVEATEQSRVTH